MATRAQNVNRAAGNKRFCEATSPTAASVISELLQECAACYIWRKRTTHPDFFQVKYPLAHEDVACQHLSYKYGVKAADISTVNRIHNHLTKLLF